MVKENSENHVILRKQAKTPEVADDLKRKR